jgi:soluble lytic murein transglycosylase-like protein
MTKKAFAAFVSIFVFAAIMTATAYAGSMLTSPPTNSNNGLNIIGERNCAEDAVQSGDNKLNENMFNSLRQKMDKIWGAQEVQKMMTSKDDIIESSKILKKYPGIFVRYKGNTKSTAYRYKYAYKTSRSGMRKPGVAGYANLIDISPIIVREAEKNGISPLLLKAVIQTESGFNNYAISPAGALGLCQMIPSTARMMGVRNAFDPEDNIKGGAKYLGILKKMFKSTDLMLAAYNAGPGMVSRAAGIPNIYETRRYVKKVRQNMKW